MPSQVEGFRMIVRFRMSKDAPEARELAAKLRADHYCPLGGPDGLIGFARKVEEQDGNACITAEISDPDTVDSITKKFGYNEPVDVDVDKLGANNPLAAYMRDRFPRCLPELRVHHADER